MKIEIRNFIVNQTTITPTLTLTVLIHYYGTIEAILSVSGELLTEDNKIIAQLQEGSLTNEETTEIKKINPVPRSQILSHAPSYSNVVYLHATLTDKAIDHIEKLREKNSEKGVRIRYNITCTTIELPVERHNTVDEITIKIKKNKFTDTIEVKQSDWVSNYSPKLGIGNYLLLELEIPNGHEVGEKWTGLYKTAQERIAEMESTMRHGDWQKVMDIGRRFFDTLKIGDKKAGNKEFEADLIKLFEEDRHTATGVGHLLNGIWQFHEYNSKFIHERDKQGNLTPIPIATKEDAYFIYALAIGLLNVIGKKISKK